MFDRILIATDGSKFGEKAAKVGIELAKLSGGKVIVVYVADTAKYISSAVSSLLSEELVQMQSITSWKASGKLEKELRFKWAR